MKVYVITAGEYSAYHICAVTANPESAENLRLLYSDEWNGEAEIEEFDTEELSERPKTYWRVQSYEGRMCSCREFPITNECEVECKLNSVTCNHSVYTVDVVAKDRAHAIKIAQDLIAQYKYEHKVERGETE